MMQEAGNVRPRRGGLMVGVLILTVFAALWAAVGISGIQGNAVLVAVAAVLAVAVTAVVFTLSRRAVREGETRAEREARTDRPELPASPDPEVGGNYRRFGLINMAQTVAIVAAVMILGRLDAWILVPPAVCLIVGLHFLPLAGVFGQPPYRWAGLLLVAVALAGILASAVGAEPGTVRALVGTGAALVLWATALRVARGR
ncbi:hypothetical protein [Streptomyces kanamyceticus]|uniref:hypothetical protein n=1 Tax=Streptomyces kanamyceticus TaxID=1967 RepID=UPI001F0AAD75|nr:hypothetical protein [Streptomyces kanamyceticus]